ncbi:MAG: tRNA uridine(34) 5-carboxymethylaminomethyl modification radical SAM/GNAT enzyme Elp3, partial [Candidatus Diapherotrites archaeon]|nr:tRNA uridine(34) 5-carboxymethylaminomethyl modification radical SAM/GNAT enzyme Elp3 [Candidatus Diapherotrites archaeon]
MSDYSLLIERLLSTEDLDDKKIQNMKKKFCQEQGFDSVPTNGDILSQTTPEEYEKLKHLLQMKPVRTISGVAVVAVMTPPKECPHGKCTYCPGGPDMDAPQSYTGHEPAAMRGAQNQFDGFYQVQQRIRQLNEIGHNTDKVELIIMGGTFPAEPLITQRTFVKRCFDALNEEDSENLEEAQKLNEKAKHRMVGMTFETRPDYSKKKEIPEMLRMGGTRVELGVQNPDDNIYMQVNRGHTVKDVEEATQLLKDSAFKIVYHLMPGMPGSNPKKDVEMTRLIFSDERFKPDMLKLYPCLVVKGSEIYEDWKQGKYMPYDTETATKVVARMKEEVPRYVRIMRVQRDIPAKMIDAGVMHSNLRELAQKEMAKPCECIRCRELGHKMLKEKIKPDWESVKINVMEYDASQGKEIFISADEEKHDALIGYCRLRIPSENTIM